MSKDLLLFFPFWPFYSLSGNLVNGLALIAGSMVVDGGSPPREYHPNPNARIIRGGGRNTWESNTDKWTPDGAPVQCKTENRK